MTKMTQVSTHTLGDSQFVRRDENPQSTESRTRYSHVMPIDPIHKE